LFYISIYLNMKNMIELDKLKTIYKFGENLNVSDIQILLGAARKSSFSSSEYLIKEGAVRKDIFFIRKGLIRVFIINDKGDEITMAIKHENQIVASPDVIFFGQPSRTYFEALEPTETLSMDYDLIQSIIAENPKLETNRKFIFHYLMKEALQRIDSFVLCTPEERYLKFVQSNPDIINRVPNKYIANILGITPVSLSRIRKRIALRKK